jgi:hypothetical protein
VLANVIDLMPVLYNSYGHREPPAGLGDSG